MEVKRILQVLTIMDQGGAETMVMNYYRALDKTKYQFDFLVNRQERGFYDDEIESMGGHIYRAFPIRPWTYFRYFRWLDNFFKEHHDYIAVHGHILENSGFIHKYAKKYGITRCISHSHAAFTGIDLRYPFRVFGKYFIRKYSTINLACGEKAGKYLYGGIKFELMNNAIATEEFTFNRVLRDKVRSELGIGDKIVIGEVARLAFPKNQKFLVEVFAELLKQKPNAFLLLVGDGVDKQDINNQISDLGIQENTMILSKRSDVNELLQAFDVFVMPSIFEGLPVSVIEAQAAGLPCVLSNTIDKNTDITGNVTFVSLEVRKQEWVRVILSAAGNKRNNTSDMIKTAGYDAKTNICKLLNYYTQD